MARTDPKVARLAEAAFFAGCDEKALERIAMDIDMVDIKAGTTLMMEGGLSHEAYIVESGNAEVVVGGRVVAEIGEGETIGEIGLLDPSPAQSTATVRSTTDMSVLLIPHNRFQHVLEEIPSVGIAIARELARRLRVTDAKLA